MYALRKSDLKEFTPNSESICRVNDGNTNPYLHENRAVEDFLKSIEPKYNSALNKVMERKIDIECIYTIAGFVAYISTCSPTAMRLHTSPLKSILHATATTIDQNNKFPPVPEGFGATSVTELINNSGLPRIL